MTATKRKIFTISLLFFASLFTLSLLAPVYATTIHSSGFEVGDGYGDWDSTTESGSATLEIDQTTVHSGVNSSKHTGDDGSGNAYCHEDIDFSTIPFFYFECALYVESFSGHYLALVGGAYRFATASGALRIDSGYNLELTWKGTDYTEYNVDILAVSTGEWYEIAVAFYAHGSLGNYTVWVGGVENVSDTGLDTLAGGEYANYWDWGIKGGYSADVYYLDSILLTDEVPTGAVEDTEVFFETVGVSTFIQSKREKLVGFGESASLQVEVVTLREGMFEVTETIYETPKITAVLVTTSEYIVTDDDVIIAIAILAFILVLVCLALIFVHR